ncbi:sigma-70 family RNA polymerase sigma factor [Streptomyces sp. GSL17-111]|uniref:sigma-70 family RNA polymerase sigma factor n=1 Tax=Streptomyces sp. GSL17-111 TaxID=3121596 RepID=UPI0030F37482
MHSVHEPVPGRAVARPGTSHDEKVTRWALAAQRGDRVAAERFVRATHWDVWRFVAHLSGDVHAADDLAQETFVRALQSLHGFAGRSCARTWLLTIARRVVVDQRRRASSRPRIADVDDWQAAVERTQGEDDNGFEELVALRDLMDALDPPRRQAFVLTQLVGLSYADTAELVRCPVGTVRSRVSRARREMTASIKAA